jgi:hypothetical protein
LLENLKENRQLQSVAKVAQSGFGSAAGAFVKSQQYFPELFALTIALAVLLTLAAFIGRIKPLAWRRLTSNAAPGSDGAVSLAEATHEFLAVNKSLKRLGVERRQSETSAELLFRVKSSVVASGTDSQVYLNCLASFLDLYAVIRFGFASADDLKQLQKLGRDLATMTPEMAKQRKTAGISQASC